MANEKRLIDANALSDKVDESKHDNPHPQGMIRVNHRNEHDHFLRMIMDAPTVDAVEVVRCRDCEYFSRDEEYNRAWCNYYTGCIETAVNGYCYHGAKMDGGNEDV